MFEHSNFDHYDFGHVPLNRDIYLMDATWMEDYERAMVATFNGRGPDEPVGYISYASVHSVNDSTIELSWYPNISDRFHEMLIHLPRDQFIRCVGSWKYDEKPRIFVQDNWHNNLYLRSHSTFMLVDAIGVKDALLRNTLSREALIGLRGGIDVIAGRHPNISFISFADSILVKSNWQAGKFDSQVRYSYEPETFLYLFRELREVYKQYLDMNVYAVLTQGTNAYYDDALLHVSTAGHHISLNTLGLPFTQLLSIDSAARKAINDGTHRPADLYMDATFFHSLRFVFKFKRDEIERHTYRDPLLGGAADYYYAAHQVLLENLEPATRKPE